MVTAARAKGASPMEIKLKVAAVGAAVAAALAGCGSAASSHSAAASHQPPTMSSSAAASLAPAPSQGESANERLFAYGLASGTGSVPSRVVTGKVMTAYVLEQKTGSAAGAASGNAAPAESVTKIAGGYQLCGTDNNGSSFCDSLTNFITDAAGRITGVSVDGQPIAARIGTGPADTSSGLVLSDVVAYRPAGQATVMVVFRLRDVSSTALKTGSPSALAVFDTPAGQFTEDDNQSPVLATLRPGETISAYEVFDTRETTGTFSLRTNNGYESVLVSSTIHRA